MILGRDIKKCYGACYEEQRVMDPVTKRLSTQSTMKDYYFKSQKKFLSLLLYFEIH